MQRVKRTPDRSISAGIAELSNHPSVEILLSEHPTPESFCAQLAKLFQVRVTEVALLRLEHGFLKFLFPAELRTVGSIPLTSSSAVAAHTAMSKKLELFNSFNEVKHAGVFETVRLGKNESGETPDNYPIQKLMSAPVLNSDGQLLGVLEVSRKGPDLKSCGPDFTMENLQQLEAAAQIAAKAEFMVEKS
jgi:hypothetical protein